MVCLLFFYIANFSWHFLRHPSFFHFTGGWWGFIEIKRDFIFWRIDRWKHGSVQNRYSSNVRKYAMRRRRLSRFCGILLRNWTMLASHASYFCGLLLRNWIFGENMDSYMLKTAPRSGERQQSFGGFSCIFLLFFICSGWSANDWTVWPKVKPLGQKSIGESYSACHLSQSRTDRSISQNPIF